METADRPLLGTDHLSAVFKPGASALGHHWILRDGNGDELGRTKLLYEGAGKPVGRLMRNRAGPIAGVAWPWCRPAARQDQSPQ